MSQYEDICLHLVENIQECRFHFMSSLEILLNFQYNSKIVGVCVFDEHVEPSTVLNVLCNLFRHFLDFSLCLLDLSWFPQTFFQFCFARYAIICIDLFIW